ncbi:hypothetical protein PM082_022669 [Marasmius tenuissimus]|nr:hypothetical protein PM082_022669 [Marasmius tenuissimus]
MLHPPPPTNAYRNPMVYQHDRLTEEARIRDDITSLQAYDDQLLKIDVVRDQLIAHRAEARRRIQCRQHLLSSFRKIPPEIWEQIFFTFCFSDDETNLRDGQYYPHLLYPIQISEHRHMKPYMLSQVCFHWRNIVNQCHALWTRISIDLSLFLPSGDAPLQKQALRTLRVISERSGRLPLELRLESYALDEDRSYFAVTPSLRRAFKEAFSRTQYLDATIDIFRQIDFRGATAFPVLRCAVLENHGDLSLPAPGLFTNDQVQILLRAPQLQCISITTLRWVVGISPFPLRHLTNFTCYGILTRSDLEHLHHTCPTLHNLNIRVNWTTVAGERPDVLMFAELRGLVLHHDGWSPVSVLQHIVAPSLTDLTHYSPSGGSDTVDAFTDFVDRSACTLRVVSFHLDARRFVGNSHDMWCQVTERLPALEAFTVNLLTEGTSGGQETAQDLLSAMEPTRVG